MTDEPKTQTDWPKAMDLLPAEDLAIIVASATTYARRHGLSNEARRGLISMAFNVRVPVEAQYDEDSHMLIGHLIEAPQDRLLGLIREAMLDYVAASAPDLQRPTSLA